MISKNHQRWAQPVTCERWAYIADLLFTLSRWSGYRFLNHVKHTAWMRACGLALLFLALPALALQAQTVSGTATWKPNPATDNVVQYTLQLDAVPPVIVLPAACTATVCTQAVAGIPFGSNTVTVIAQNLIITGGTGLQSSAPAVVTFTINTKPVTVLGIGVSVP